MSTPKTSPELRPRISILTVSDRSARGERRDSAGPLLAEAIRAKQWTLIHQEILPDDKPSIEKRLISWCDSGECDVILTTGGTGFSPRDVTPEATEAVIEREAPGLAEAMRLASLKLTPHAMLSRAIAGIRKKTLIVNLPGSPKAALENLQTILEVFPHAVQLLQERPEAESGHSIGPVK